MKKISLKVKMSLWYTVLVAILLLIFLPISYKLLENSLMANSKSQLLDNFSMVSDYLEHKIPGENNFDKDDFTKHESKKNHQKQMVVVVFNEENKVISGNANEDFKRISPRESEYWRINTKNQEWLVYDRQLMVKDEPYNIRIIKSIQSITTTLNYIKIGFIVSVPIILTSAFGIGLLIARRALRPIYDIANTAQEIEKGDLSLRIPYTEGKDEIATLSNSFNSMVDYLEDAITREQQFSVDASHELRTPLAIILNYSDELLKDNNSNYQEEYQIINDEAVKMKKIISQLLMLARGELNQYNLDIEKVSLNEMINSIVEQMRLFAVKKNIDIEFNNDEPIIVDIDESLWTQLFINLIDNALKYTPDYGKVIIKTKEVDNVVTIIIEDNGVGINKDNLPHIFERFYQVDDSHHSQGVGLGLSLVKWIIEVHKAEIKVESKEGEGTKFIITIKK